MKERYFMNTRNIYFDGEFWTDIHPKISSGWDDEDLDFECFPVGTTLILMEREKAVFLTKATKIDGLYIEFESVDDILQCGWFKEVE